MTRTTTASLFALALLAALPAAARAGEADPAPRLLGAVGLDTVARVAEAGPALGTPAAQRADRASRSGIYARPVGPTRDQTSPLGFDVLVTFLSRDVEEVIAGKRFEFNVDSTRFLAKPTFRLLPPVELYGLVGVADLQGDEDIANFDGDSRLAVGGGARLVLFRNAEWFDSTLFAEGRYLQFESEARGVGFDTNGDGFADTFLDEKFRWREWEGRFGVSWRFYQWRPYLGLRYSDIDADDIIEGSPVVAVDATDNIGVFVGADLYFDPSRRAGLTLEGTFPDYSSFTVGFRFWF